MKLYFIGGLFTQSNHQFIQNNSIGPIQNAADALQHAYIDGLAKNLGPECVEVINFPYVGSFPKRFKKLWIQSASDTLKSGVLVSTIGFINAPILKHINKIVSSYYAMKNRIVREKQDHIYIICYSMYLPFLISSYLASKINKNVHTCLLVLDLPEFMSDGGNKLTNFTRFLISKITYYLARRFDFLVLITEQMKERFPNQSCIVIEGMCLPFANPLALQDQESKRYILYSGTLDERYGIKELISGFINADVDDLILMICGDGDCRDFVENYANSNPSIKYLGQLERLHVCQLQKDAALLINPRRNVGDFTKFSFPSKIIEYMYSGTPVLMYPLDGIPSEYFNYCIIIKDDPRGIERAIVTAMMLPEYELKAIGARAAAFVLDKKNSCVQTRKLVNLFIK